MEYTWDVSFAKDYWTVAGGYSLCASDPCSGSIWSLYDSSTALGGSRHTGNGSFALTAGETYHFTLYEGMSSDGYQAPQGTSSSARLALSFPTSVVPLPSAALLFGAAIAALAHWRRRPSVA
jgi:hypothetical protein